MKKKIIALLLLLTLSLTACNKIGGGDTQAPDGIGNKPGPGSNNGGVIENIGNDDSTFGEDLEDLGAFDGYFEEEISYAD